MLFLNTLFIKRNRKKEVIKELTRVVLKKRYCEMRYKIMKILIDGKDYEFIYGYEPTIKEIVDEKLESLKKISENTNFTIIADRRYLYFLTLNEVEKKFIKEYHNNVNYFNEIDLQLKLKNSNVLYFKIIDENDKYEKYLTEYYEFNEKEKKNKGFKWYLINIKNINKKDIKKEVVIFFQKLKRLDFKENEIDLYKADDFFYISR